MMMKIAAIIVWRERHQDIDEELERPGAVDARRLQQFVGHRFEELAEKEGAVAEAISGTIRPV